MQTILREMPTMVGLRLLILNKIRQQKCSILMIWRLRDFRLLMERKRIRPPKEELELPAAVSSSTWTILTTTMKMEATCSQRRNSRRKKLLRPM